MSERWEQAIANWYEKSRTADLEYLDLAQTSKVTLTALANNIGVIYDRLNLLSRVHIKDLKRIFEEFKLIREENRRLRKEVANLTATVLENQPITKSQVLEIVEQITQQPKEIEKQALSLARSTEQKLQRIEELLVKLEAWSTT